MTRALRGCRWDFPSYGTIKVASGPARGYYLAAVNDERDPGSAFLRAEKDVQVSSVFEFFYQSAKDGYIIMCVSFKMGPGTDNGYAATWCASPP